MNKSESIAELVKAMVIVQANLTGAIKDSSNPFFKSKYADLESVWESCRAQLGKNGLSLLQPMSNGPNGPEVITLLAHVSGEWISGSQPVCAKNATPQELGSAITYARRYGMAAMLGIVQVDDDAETHRAPERAQPQQRAPVINQNETGIPGGLGDYVINVSKKYKGHALKDIPKNELESFFNFMKIKFNTENKPVSDEWADFMDNVSAYLNSID